MVITLWGLSHSFKTPNKEFCGNILKTRGVFSKGKFLKSFGEGINRWVLSTGFDVVQKIAMIGYDSDTYGAIAGPLLAVAHSRDLKNSDYATNILKDSSTNAYFQKLI